MLQSFPRTCRPFFLAEENIHSLLKKHHTRGYVHYIGSTTLHTSDILVTKLTLIKFKHFLNIYMRVLFSLSLRYILLSWHFKLDIFI